MVTRTRRATLALLLVCLPLVLIGAAIAFGATAHRRTRIGPGALPHRVCHARRAKASRQSACRRAASTKPNRTTSPQPAAPIGTMPSTPLEAPTIPTLGAPPTEEASAEPPSVPHVQVSAVEYHYTLSRASVPAGKVVFQFVDKGEDEHNLNIDDAEGAREAEFGDTPPKGVVNQTVVLKAGTYKLFCSLPGHEQKGMKATLTVE
jgi:plastocyanin